VDGQSGTWRSHLVSRETCVRPVAPQGDDLPRHLDSLPPRPVTRSTVVWWHGGDNLNRAVADCSSGCNLVESSAGSGYVDSVTRLAFGAPPSHKLSRRPLLDPE